MDRIPTPGFITYEDGENGFIEATGFDEMEDGKEVCLTQQNRPSLEGFMRYVPQRGVWILETENSIFVIEIQRDSRLWATQGMPKSAIGMMEEEDDDGYGFGGDWWKS